MMRAMDITTLRGMNPQFAQLSDEQIRMSIDQMEMMANNPSMLKYARPVINDAPSPTVSCFHTSHLLTSKPT